MFWSTTTEKNCLVFVVYHVGISNSNMYIATYRSKLHLFFGLLQLRLYIMSAFMCMQIETDRLFVQLFENNMFACRKKIDCNGFHLEFLYANWKMIAHCWFNHERPPLFHHERSNFKRITRKLLFQRYSASENL